MFRLFFNIVLFFFLIGTLDVIICLRLKFFFLLLFHSHDFIQCLGCIFSDNHVYGMHYYYFFLLGSAKVHALKI